MEKKNLFEEKNHENWPNSPDLKFFLDTVKRNYVPLSKLTNDGTFSVASEPSQLGYRSSRRSVSFEQSSCRRPSNEYGRKNMLAMQPTNNLGNNSQSQGAPETPSPGVAPWFDLAYSKTFLNLYMGILYVVAISCNCWSPRIPSCHESEDPWEFLLQNTK